MGLTSGLMSMTINVKQEDGKGCIETTGSRILFDSRRSEGTYACHCDNLW